ncbi:MAG: helix-turn-helix domain-containing protein [Ignavibacteria bacterium]|nr:helix-turn-helix domain-containing protein [Ignavibacteria bacterium]
MKPNFDITYKLIDLLGKEKIEEAYNIVKSYPVSFSLLRKTIIHDEIKNDVYSGSSINDVVKKHKVSRMTVYRIIKENL